VWAREHLIRVSQIINLVEEKEKRVGFDIARVSGRKINRNLTFVLEQHAFESALFHLAAGMPGSSASHGCGDASGISTMDLSCRGESMSAHQPPSVSGSADPASQRPRSWRWHHCPFPVTPAGFGGRGSKGVFKSRFPVSRDR